MGLFDWLSKPPSRDAFAKMVMDGIRRAGETGAISYDKAEFLLVAPNQKAYLGNLYHEFCTVPRSDRSGIVQRTVSQWSIRQGVAAAADLIKELSQQTKGVNWESALENAGGDRELLAELCQTALEEFPRLLTGIRRAVEECDRASFLSNSCGLKGCLTIFDVVAAVGLAQQMKDFAMQSQFAGADELYPTLESEVNLVIAALREGMPRMRGPGPESPKT